MSEMNRPSLEGRSSPDFPGALVPRGPSYPVAVYGESGFRPSEPSSQFLTPRQVVDALRYWWKLALPLGLLLAAGAGAAVWFRFQPVYEAAAWLRIEERAPYVAFDVKSEGRSFVQTQVELMRSPMVLGPVLGDAQVAAMPDILEQENKIAWLASKLRIRGIGQSELFMVSFAGTDPTGSAHVVNTIVDEYFKQYDQEEVKRSQRIIELLRQEKDRKATEVAQLRDNVRELAKQMTGKDPFAVNANANTQQTHPLGDLQSRLVSAEVDEQILKAKIKAFEEFTAGHRPDVSPSSIEKAVSENAQVRALTEALVLKRARLRELESVLVRGKEDPFYRKAREELTEAEPALERLKAGLRQQTRSELETEVLKKREEELAAMRSDMETRRITRTLLRERYENDLRSIKQYNGDTLNLKFKQDELARAERVYELISDRALRLQTEQSAPARVSLLRKAEPSVAPLEAFPLRKILLAAMAGFCLPFGLAVLKERITRRVSDPDNLEHESHLAVVGEIARLSARAPAARRPLRKGRDRTFRLFEESIDSLRTNVFLSSGAQTPRILTVTSAINHEGKTSVAVQLAISIARATQELTLLVDGDLRSPGVHRVFDVPLEPGLAKLLTGESDLENAVQATWIDLVHVLPAGRLHGSPHRLLNTEALKSFLEKVPAGYRHVVIDTPPVLAASEAMVMAKAADATLICAMRDVSRIDQVKKASERLGAAGVSLAGMVLSGVPVHQYMHRYGHYPYPAE